MVIKTAAKPTNNLTAHLAIFQKSGPHLATFNEEFLGRLKTAKASVSDSPVTHSESKFSVDRLDSDSDLDGDLIMEEIEAEDRRSSSLNVEMQSEIIEDLLSDPPIKPPLASRPSPIFVVSEDEYLSEIDEQVSLENTAISPSLSPASTASKPPPPLPTPPPAKRSRDDFEDLSQSPPSPHLNLSNAQNNPENIQTTDSGGDLYSDSDSIEIINSSDSGSDHDIFQDMKQVNAHRPSMNQAYVVEGPERLAQLQAEKIGLLERKITLLSNDLKRRGISVDTYEIDKNILVVEAKISEAGVLIPTEKKRDAPVYNYAGDDIPASDPVYDITPDRGTRTAISILSDEEDELHREANSPYFSKANGNLAVPSQIVEATVSEDSPVEYPWSREVLSVLRNKFGIQAFRKNQQAAIDASLSGKDVVVLMPTGGGKSLCYQLPALINSGTTRGCTVVISPLLSLMADQIFHLKAKNIAAEMLSGTQSFAERTEIIRQLRAGELNLLYVSPEMLSSSGSIQRQLQDLHSQNMLARIVIDEAHCVSSWGHDFRTDYQDLKRLKTEYPGVPLIALTATANRRVLLDMSQCVRENALYLTQSFNRPNLIYEVRKKNQNVLNEIAAICRQYSSSSGIIYCNSRNSCEQTAENLRNLHISADFYHAGLDPDRRKEIQSNWQEGRTKVICATIAFGMGIDKPDVRYVIHYTLPRTMEGYYQETGRAGRDGKQSICVLFFTYRDSSMLLKFILQEENRETRRRHEELLNRVVQYCSNDTDCRRKQILQYFDEQFDPAQCRGTCDCCRDNYGRMVQRDLTESAQIVIRFLRSIESTNVSLALCTDALRGSRRADVINKRFDQNPMFGKLAEFDKTVVARLLNHLVAMEVCQERAVASGRGNIATTYLQLGPRSQQVFQGTKVLLDVRDETPSKKSAPSKKAKRGISNQSRNRRVQSTPTPNPSPYYSRSNIRNTQRRPVAKNRSIISRAC